MRGDLYDFLQMLKIVINRTQNTPELLQLVVHKNTRILTFASCLEYEDFLLAEIWTNPKYYHRACEIMGLIPESKPRSIIKIQPLEVEDELQWYEIDAFLDLLEDKYVSSRSITRFTSLFGSMSLTRRRAVSFT